MGKPVHIAVGNVNVDVFMVVPRLPGFDEDVEAIDVYVDCGGAAANYSVAAARLGHVARLVAHIGLSGLGAVVAERLQSRGVDLSLAVLHDELEPGVVSVMVAPDGEKAMVSYRGANKLLDGTEVEEACDVLHVASQPPRVLANASSRVAAGIASYDPGGKNAPRHGRGVLEAARAAADILFLNRVEAVSVLGSLDVDTARHAVAGRLRYVVVKLGSQGALIASRDEALMVEAYAPGQVVDTTGAGDVFNAFFNGFLAEGARVDEAARAASVAAGLKVGRRGAQSAPTRSEVEEMLATRPPRVKRLV